MEVLNTENIPIKFWLPLDEVEEGALEQAKNLANLPFAYKWIAIMPDTHRGYGMPIGGVLATKNVVVPNAVGVDIGCGMCAVKTNRKVVEFSQDDIKEIMGKIRESVPVGFSHHEKEQDVIHLPVIHNDRIQPIVSQEYKSARRQVGTLGGGNHFIELQKDSEDTLWVMIHSGSRNLGHTVAEHYHKIAQELCETYYSNIPTLDLAFLPVGSEFGQRYIAEMEYCVEFAYKNRRLMMDRVLKAIGDVEEERFINIAHNYASLESHYGDNVWVHRKGATLARECTEGIIPGSQGAQSYIVRGKGNPESFHTCSHGAGRLMSRTQAKKEIDLDSSKKKMEDKGIIHAVRNKGDLDEAPEAYKDISVVIERQKDLIDVDTILEPLAVVKG